LFVMSIPLAGITSNSFVLMSMVLVLKGNISPPRVRNGPDEARLMANAALSIDSDVIGGIEIPIVHVCFIRSFIPQSIDNLAISGMCPHGSARGITLYVLVVVGARRIMVFHIICLNADKLDTSLTITRSYINIS